MINLSKFKGLPKTVKPLLEVEEPTKDEIWYINRQEKWNKMALINTRDAIKKANADLKLLNIEKDLIRNIKKKWKS